jgi:hypothetical protein
MSAASKACRQQASLVKNVLVNDYRLKMMPERIPLNDEMTVELKTESVLHVHVCVPVCVCVCT